mmetsp:Transcript_23461/g.47499  ORF Transcript_23461/g.47499 Transcript_23461/m.47499 type:complete len:237 (-) Transcript_23461:318-1028(-)
MPSPYVILIFVSAITTQCMVAILGCTVVALELTGHGDDLPPMFQYVLWLGLTQVNSFIGLGYTAESHFHKDRLGQEVHIQLPALPIKDPRELALGSFFAGERLRSDRNLTVFDLGCGNCSVVAALKQRAGELGGVHPFGRRLHRVLRGRGAPSPEARGLVLAHVGAGEEGVGVGMGAPRADGLRAPQREVTAPSYLPDRGNVKASVLLAGLLALGEGPQCRLGADLCLWEHHGLLS